MPDPETKCFPEWAERERGSDLGWIKASIHVFCPTAQQGWAELGRGAIVVDITLRPAGAGHPFGYVPQATVE